MGGDDEQANAPEPRAGLGSEGGPGGREDEAQLVDGAAEVFGSGPKAGLAAPAVDVKTLHAKLGELTSTDDFRPAGSARPAF